MKGVIVVKHIEWKRGKQIQLELVCEIEKIWNVKFPKEYVEIIQKCDGGRPKINNKHGELKSALLDVEKFGPIGPCLLSLSNGNDIKSSTIMVTYNAFKETLPIPEKIFPFADDGGGNHLYFDYRMNENNPSIVFQHHEKAISKDDLSELDLKKRPLKEWLNESLYPVADSFEALLEMLYPAEW